MSGRIIIHLLGTSDVGVATYAPPGSRGDKPSLTPADRLKVLEQALDRAETDPIAEAEIRGLFLEPAPEYSKHHSAMPLQTLLRQCDARPDDHLLLAVTSGHDPKGRQTAPFLPPLLEALRRYPDLYGTAIPSSIDRVDIEQPVINPGRGKIREYLADRCPDKVVLGYGSGAKGAALGLLLGCLEAGLPLSFIPLQEQHGTPSLHIGGDLDPRSWLARQRMFLGLAAAARSEQEKRAWQALDMRQRQDPDFKPSDLDIKPAGELADQLAPRSHESYENAFFDRLIRGETAALLHARSWLYDRYGELVEQDSERQEWRYIESRSVPLGPLKESVNKRATRNSMMAGRAPAVFISSDLWLYLNFIAKMAAHETLGIPSRRLLRRLADHAARSDARDPRRELAVDPNPTRWRSTPSGRLLILMDVGMQRDALNSMINAVLSHPYQEVTSVARVVWSIDLVLVASPCVPDGADEKPRSRGTKHIADCEIAALSAGEGYEAALLRRLSSPPQCIVLPEPDGTEGSGGLLEVSVEQMREDIYEQLRAQDDAADSMRRLRDAEAVVFLGNPGTHGMNLATLLAATDWGVTAGCPVYVGAVEERWDGGKRRSVVEMDPEQVAAFPGYDWVLATVARGQLDALELHAAARTLRRGGPVLREVAGDVEALRAAAYSACRDVAGLDHLAEAARRVELVRVAVAADPWDAVYLAVAMIEATVPSERRGHIREQNGAVKALARVRNASPASHGRDGRALAYVLAVKWPTDAIRTVRDAQRASPEVVIKVVDSLLTAARDELLRSRDATGISTAAGAAGPGAIELDGYRSRYNSIVQQLAKILPPDAPTPA